MENELVDATNHHAINHLFDSFRRGNYSHQYVKRRVRNIIRASLRTRRVNKVLQEMYEYKQYTKINKKRNENENKIENRATGI